MGQNFRPVRLNIWEKWKNAFFLSRHLFWENGTNFDLASSPVHFFDFSDRSRCDEVGNAFDGSMQVPNLNLWLFLFRLLRFLSPKNKLFWPFFFDRNQIRT